MVDTAVELKNFAFRYDKGYVLNDINLSIAKGEYVSIIGPNGSGKSTLLKCLNRVVKGGEGTINIMGKSMFGYSQKELAKSVAYVPQHLSSAFSYTVDEFVTMGRYPYLKAFSPMTSEDQQAVEKAIQLTGLSDLRLRPLNQLSGGERQKTYLAAALAQEPDILILDEPTTHLDPKFQKDVQKTVCDVSRNLGITVLHVTHDLNHILTWSEKIVALKAGHVCYYGLSKDVMTADHLKNVFETDFHLLADPVEGHPIIVPEAH
ncbi:MAG: ABC transporter ATP-binding protein [Candidatus Omnitrophica bacterium]|nr:ABC transporter ATP-binding protein [Candidatus Omnitrophota bacterium]